jgi:hypothetical protein
MAEGKSSRERVREWRLSRHGAYAPPARRAGGGVSRPLRGSGGCNRLDSIALRRRGSRARHLAQYSTLNL